MEEASDDSWQGSNLLKLLGIVVGSFALLQTVMPITPLTGLLTIFIAKICWRKFQVKGWGRFWVGATAVLLSLFSVQAHQAGLTAIVAKARLNALNLSPKEKGEVTKVIREQTFSALLMDPLNWRRWKSWSDTKDRLDDAGFE